MFLFFPFIKEKIIMYDKDIQLLFPDNTSIEISLVINNSINVFWEYVICTEGESFQH